MSGFGQYDFVSFGTWNLSDMEHSYHKCELINLNSPQNIAGVRIQRKKKLPKMTTRPRLLFHRLYLIFTCNLAKTYHFVHTSSCVNCVIVFM